jgi:hypothetical protein
MSRLPRRRADTRARAIVLGGIFVFLALQAGLSAAMSSWPVLRDPDYGNRIVRLEALVREHPRKPLLLVLGSSHTALGFRPDVVMQAWSEGAEPPAVFNFSRLGNGPLFELLYLHRLLARGIRPAWVLLELWPLLLDDRNLDGREDERLDVHRLQSGDWPVLARHSTLHQQLHRQWWWDGLTPWYSQRSTLMGYFAPLWRRVEPFGDFLFAGLDEWGWREWAAMNRDRYRREAQRMTAAWNARLANLQPSARAEREIREVLQLCREHAIAVSLLLMPESSGLRATYSAGAKRRLAEYLRKLADEHGAPLIDTRDWSPDEDFGDADHLTAEGATRFTRRFAEMTGTPQRDHALALRPPRAGPVSRSTSRQAAERSDDLDRGIVHGRAIEGKRPGDGGADEHNEPDG